MDDLTILRFVFIAFIATALSFCSEPPADPGRVDPPEIVDVFRFTKALAPIPFDPEREATRAETKRMADSAGCAECHTRVYENWHESRHRVAFTNPLYKESHAREPSRWCVNCHAPLVDQREIPGGNVAPSALGSMEPIQSEDGISCVVCHVRRGKMLTGAMPEPKAGGEGFAHDYRIVPIMRRPEFCGSCHQFNFLTASTAASGTRTRGSEQTTADPDSATFEYSDLVMQNTLGEWRNSSYGKAGSLTCQNCHLRPGGPESHTFPGGHDLSELARAIGLEARRAENDRLEVRIFSVGVGHAFPTGDLFRALRIKLFTEQGVPVREIVLKKRYENAATENGERNQLDPRLPSKRLVEDGVIPPPVAGDFVSSRTLVVKWPKRSSEILRFEMYIDYLERSNHLLTRLPLSMTSPLFKRGRIRIHGEDESFVY